MSEKEVAFTVRVKDAATAALKQVENAAAKTGEKLFSLKSILGAATGALAAFSVGALVKDMLDLAAASDKAMRSIAANLPTGVAGIAKLKSEITDLGLASGRSLEEMQAAAVQIAHLGVGSASEVTARLKAATELSDATGTSLTETVSGLDQLMDAFSLSAEQAEETLANLVSAAKGRVDIESLFGALQKATPVLQEFHIDVDTGTKALVALLDAGHSAKQVGADLGKLDAEGIRELAATATIAATAVQDLRTQAELNEGALAADLERYKTRWKTALADLATVIVSGSSGIYQALETMGARASSLLTRILGAGKPDAFAKDIQVRMLQDHAGDNDVDGGGDLGASAGAAATDAATAAIIKRAEARKEGAKVTEEAAKQAADLGKQLDALMAKEAAGGAASVDFAARIAEWKEKMIAGGASLEQINAKLQGYQATLRTMHDEESLKKQAEDAKTAADAFDALADAFLKLSGGAVNQLDAEYARLFKTLEEQSGKITDPAQFYAAQAQIAALRGQYDELRAAVQDTSDTSAELAQIQQVLGDHPPIAPETLTIFDELTTKATALREKISDAVGRGAQPEADEYKKSLAQIEEILSKITGTVFTLPATTEDSGKKALAVAEAWSTVGRSVIAAAQAIGQMDDKTAAALQNVVTLGDGITKLFSGDIAGGAAETITSTASLLSGMFGESPADKERLKVIQSNTQAIQQLTIAAKTSGLMGTNLSGSTASLAGQSVAALLKQFTALATNVYHTDVSQVHTGDLSGYLTPEQLAAVTAAAKAFNIELNGTGASLQQLADAMHIGLTALGRFGTDFTGMMARIDAETKINGDFGSESGLAKFASNIGPLSHGIAGIFDGIDWSKALTADELDAMRARVQSLFALMEGGGLSTEQMGGLNGDQFLQMLEAITDGLNQLAPAAKSAADVLSGALSGTSDYDSIHNVTDPTTLFGDKAKAYAGAGGSLGALFQGFDLSNLNAGDIAKLDTSFQALFDQLKDSPQTVDLAGLSMDDLVKALLDLNSSAQSVAQGVETAAQKMAAAESKLSDDFNIFGTDATGQANAYAGLYGFDLSGFDLSTASGVSGATSYLQDLYKQHPELAHQIENTLGAIRQIQTTTSAIGSGIPANASVSSATSATAAAFQSLTTVQGDRLADVLLRSLNVQMEIRDALTARVNIPTFAPLALGGAAAAAGGITIGTIVVNPSGAGATDGKQLADDFMRELEIKTGRKILVQRAYNGGIRVSPT